jgi:predicted GH43/DUF377 family glycosyl hydrolase
MDIAKRFSNNPILKPSDCIPSREGLEVVCLLNPGAFRFNGRTGLLLRVAERPHQTEGKISFPIIDLDAPGGIGILEFSKDDPDVGSGDPRGIVYKGKSYLTTLSHLRLAWSDDGVSFTIEPTPTLIGTGPLESFGIEDCRVTFLGGRYWLTYTAVSPNGITVGLISTSDWISFERHGVIFPPTNKDVAIFEDMIGRDYITFHRPSSVLIGGSFIWTARSTDLVHWGRHHCLALTRENSWDSQRVGAGASPIKTDMGWLAIYHGADDSSRYCLGALLLDSKEPEKVLARSVGPIMEPNETYEQTGFFGNVVFTNGHIVEGDKITMYYGASDEVICGATLSIQEILATLEIAQAPPLLRVGGD